MVRGFDVVIWRATEGNGTVSLEEGLTRFKCLQNWPNPGRTSTDSFWTITVNYYWRGEGTSVHLFCLAYYKGHISTKSKLDEFKSPFQPLGRCSFLRNTPYILNAAISNQDTGASFRGYDPLPPACSTVTNVDPLQSRPHGTGNAAVRKPAPRSSRSSLRTDSMSALATDMFPTPWTVLHTGFQLDLEFQ